MSRYNGEEVLVIPRPLFDEIGSFQGIATDHERYISRVLSPESNFFMDREAAEDDPTHKQIIPYALLCHGDQVLHYTRGKSGGESRLHAQGSVGIGGHINPIDSREDALGHATYMAGVERELAEELVIDCSYTQRIVALLNDDTNPVGQVHLGVVHLFELDGLEVRANEDPIANLAWQPIERLKGELFDKLETWSQHCIRELDKLRP